jgi:hypothetical protein
VAAVKTGVTRNYLAAIGFGIEHNLNHHSCLENILKQGDYLGALSLTGDMAEGKSIASAIRGEFGDFHSTRRTKGTVQFVNSLMNMFWFFRTEGIAPQIKFSSEIENSAPMLEVAKAFQLYRLKNDRRTSQSIPLK